MKNLKIVTNNDLKNWAKEIFEKNSFKMIDVSEKKKFAADLNIIKDELHDLINFKINENEMANFNVIF